MLETNETSAASVNGERRDCMERAVPEIISGAGDVEATVCAGGTVQPEPEGRNRDRCGVPRWKQLPAEAATVIRQTISSIWSPATAATTTAATTARAKMAAAATLAATATDETTVATSATAAATMVSSATMRTVAATAMRSTEATAVHRRKRVPGKKSDVECISKAYPELIELSNISDAEEFLAGSGSVAPECADGSTGRYSGRHDIGTGCDFGRYVFDRRDDGGNSCDPGCRDGDSDDVLRAGGGGSGFGGHDSGSPIDTDDFDRQDDGGSGFVSTVATVAATAATSVTTTATPSSTARTTAVAASTVARVAAMVATPVAATATASSTARAMMAAAAAATRWQLRRHRLRPAGQRRWWHRPRLTLMQTRSDFGSWSAGSAERRIVRLLMLIVPMTVVLTVSFAGRSFLLAKSLKVITLVPYGICFPLL